MPVDAAWRLRFRSGDEWSDCALDEASGIRFETTLQARERKRFHGLKNKRGWYYFATTRDMKWCESRFEMKALRDLDFDRQVVAIAVQPFVLHFRDTEGRAEHTPDVFARLAHGGAKVVDIRPKPFAAKPDFVRKCAAMKVACRAVGWSFEVVEEFHPVLDANIDWLAGYRHELVDPHGVTPAILDACTTPQPIGALVAAFPSPALTRSVLFHLLWTGQLSADLCRPLRDTTPVVAAETPRRRHAS